MVNIFSFVEYFWWICCLVIEFQTSYKTTTTTTKTHVFFYYHKKCNLYFRHSPFKDFLDFNVKNIPSIRYSPGFHQQCVDYTATPFHCKKKNNTACRKKLSSSRLCGEKPIASRVSRLLSHSDIIKYGVQNWQKGVLGLVSVSLRKHQHKIGYLDSLGCLIIDTVI